MTCGRGRGRGEGSRSGAAGPLTGGVDESTRSNGGGLRGRRGLGAAASASAAPPAPLDPQNWSFQDNLTWSDYKPIPGPDYSDPSIQPTVKKWKVALILVDYPDRPFTISQPAGSTVFGTPSARAHSVPREQVPQFYADFLNKPSALNNFQTMNRYWMEDSFGKYGVELVPFGPYRMPLKSYQYHISNFQNVAAGLPEPRRRATPTRRRATRTSSPPRAAPGAPTSAPTAEARDLRQQVLDLRGPGRERRMAGVRRDALHRPGGGHRRVRPEGTSTRCIREELGDDALRAVDLVGRGRERVAERRRHQLDRGRERRHGRLRPRALAQPRASRTTTTTRSRPPPQRTAGGMWDMMSRGSFNGPGGQHTRWQIPPTQGAALGAQHNLRNKRFLNFIGDNDILRLNRDGLAQTGLAVAEVKAREVAPSGDLAGVRVAAQRRGRHQPALPLADGPDRARARGTRRPTGSTVGARFNDYTMEVVQQIGSDSFAPGHGVLIGKTKTGSSTCGSFSCFVWYIDSNPQDINQVDFVQGRRHAGEGDARRRAPAQRRLVQRRR